MACGLQCETELLRVVLQVQRNVVNGTSSRRACCENTVLCSAGSKKLEVAISGMSFASYISASNWELKFL